MPTQTMLVIAAVFCFAGIVKGVIGLGLPTVSMGLLALVMPPMEAAAILVLPSLVTNVWQLFSGPSLAAVARRLWPMMVAVCIGTWAGRGLMTGAPATYGTTLLGAALVAYAVLGLAAVGLSMPRSSEWFAGPLAGAVTGAITAATGVFVIPAVPYLQAIGLERDELVQALGLSFTVSTMALAVNVFVAGGFTGTVAGATATALVAACAGMCGGQAIRSRLSAAAFRRLLFIGLLALGLHLLARLPT